MKIALLFPELLGTYGDGGNARVLSHRARLRGIAADVIEVRLGDSLPDAQIFLLGGGEDGPQRQATEALRSDGSLSARIADGSQLFAVCAGLQILGQRFAVAGGGSHEGLGLLDLVSERGESRRVGELAVSVGVHTLVGFENHGGVTTLGSCAPLGRVRVGFGDDGKVDGARAPGIVTTYAHGPVLAMNPWLADEVLAAALNRELDPVPSVADRLHAARIAKLQGRFRP
jgi:CobQ-like glutamine amidotransferase family enzyme